MNNQELEQMKQSCHEFAQQKTIWTCEYPYQFDIIREFIKITVYLSDGRASREIGFYVVVPTNNTQIDRKLEATTAKEATEEALKMWLDKAFELFAIIIGHNLKK